MVNQQSKFAAALAKKYKTKPLRHLLGSKIDWFLGDTQNEAFNNTKKLLNAEPVLAFYLGAEIKQKQSDGEFKTVAYRSFH